ncbi:MAG: hypothetical protein AAGF48_13985 [Pseudomonadota bacterium]
MLLDAVLIEAARASLEDVATALDGVIKHFDLHAFLVLVRTDLSLELVGRYAPRR